MIRYALYLTARQWPYAVTAAIVTGFLVRPEWIWLWASLLAAWVLAWGTARSVRLRRQRETARRRIAVIARARAGAQRRKPVVAPLSRDGEALTRDELAALGHLERSWRKPPVPEPERRDVP